MYLEFFGLKELPFTSTPNTAFIFECRAHQEALNTLLFALQSGEGFVKIVGEVGTGKTLLCRRLLQGLEKTHVTAYLPIPNLEPRTLLLGLAEELRLGLPPDIDQYQLLRAIKKHLLDVAQKGKRVVVCIDEAQSMPYDSLEALRLLSNLETERRKLLQIVLFGQPELDERLADKSIRQLKQRIAFQYRLTGLSAEEAAVYLFHRMRIAGYKGPMSPFSAKAAALLARYTDGTPRLLNILAHKSLLSAYGSGVREVNIKQVKLAATDTEWVAMTPFWQRLRRYIKL